MDGEGIDKALMVEKAGRLTAKLPVAHLFALFTILGLLLTTVSLGCRIPTLHQLNYSRKEPAKAALIGTWVPDHATLRLMREKGGYDPSVQTKLVLKSDDTFDLADIPDWWSDPKGHSTGQFEQSAGTWRTWQHNPGTFWNLQLRSSSETRFANLIGQAPPYKIEFTIGDADENESMIFTKQ